jgi:hypothetical protein
MNPNDARLVRIYTRKQHGTVSSETPIKDTVENTAQFEVVVEGEAGVVLMDSGARYTLRISAIDLTELKNPNDPGVNDFTQTFDEAFIGGAWRPQYTKVITVTLRDVAAVRDHTLRYFATLNSYNNTVDSAIESLPFSLMQ